MKRVGPSGPKTIIPRRLEVIISIEKESVDIFSMREIIPNPCYYVTFHFAQFADGYYVRGFFAKTFGTYRGDIDSLRCQMMQNKYWECVDTSDKANLWHESTEPFSVEVKDPDKVLEWLFPNMDLTEFFNQKPENANEPLRLSPADPRASK